MIFRSVTGWLRVVAGVGERARRCGVEVLRYLCLERRKRVEKRSRVLVCLGVKAQEVSSGGAEVGNVQQPTLQAKDGRGRVPAYMHATHQRRRLSAGGPRRVSEDVRCCAPLHRRQQTAVSEIVHEQQAHVSCDVMLHHLARQRRERAFR